MRILPDLRILVTGVIRSRPHSSMLLLTTVLLFIYGMLGWLLFAEEILQTGNIGRAMLSLFVLLTLEDFPRYMERGMWRSTHGRGSTS